MKAVECTIVAQVLNKAFSYILFPLTYSTNILEDESFMTDRVLHSPPLDLASIICHWIIQAVEEKNITNSLPYPKLVTALLQIQKIPFPPSSVSVSIGSPISLGMLQLWGFI